MCNILVSEAIGESNGHNDQSKGFNLGCCPVTCNPKSAIYDYDLDQIQTHPCARRLMDQYGDW